MTTDRLAALLDGAIDRVSRVMLRQRYDDPDLAVAIQRMKVARDEELPRLAQGVRVGDDGLTVLDAWRVLEREYPEATVARLRAALAAQPAPPALDREPCPLCGHQYPHAIADDA